MILKDYGESCIAYFDGEINLNAINKFKEDMNNIDETAEKTVILNFSNVSYINSLGLGTIVELYKKSKVKKRNLKIVCASPVVREVFEVVKFNKLIPMFDTDEDAINDK